MTMIASQLHELGRLDEDFGVEAFVRAGQQIGGYHIALSEIIHIIYDITEEQDLAIMMAQGEKIQTALNGEDPQGLDDIYEPQCNAILRTYLPRLFKEEEYNGA